MKLLRVIYLKIFRRKMSKLNNIIETLKALDKINKTLKAKTIDQKLTEMEFYDRQQEIFKPITNEIKKQSRILITKPGISIFLDHASIQQNNR